MADGIALAFDFDGLGRLEPAVAEFLKAAGIKPVDKRGVKVTFHSLRYGLATALDKSGATLKERMTILRHSTTGNLTLGVYTTVEVVDLRGAVERLPLYPWPSEVQAKSEVA